MFDKKFEEFYRNFNGIWGKLGKMKHKILNNNFEYIQYIAVEGVKILLQKV